MENNTPYGLGFKNPIVITITSIIAIFFLALFIFNPTSRSSTYAYGMAVVFWVCAYVYLIPSIIALSKKHPQFISILILNLFLGETIIAWIVALIWASSYNPNNYYTRRLP